MDKANLPHGWKVYAPLLVLLVIFVLLMPRSGKFNYDYRKGVPWMYETLVAQFDFPVLKTSEQLQAEKEQASANVIPYYRYSENIVNDAQAALKATPLGKYDTLKSEFSRIMSAIYEKGIIENVSGKETAPDEDGVIFVQREKRATEVPASEVFTPASAKQRYLAAAGPDLPLSVIRLEDAPDFLPCFDEADLLYGIPGLPILMSYCPEQIMDIGEESYLVGPMVFFRIDHIGNTVSLQVADLYQLAEFLEEHSVILMQGGESFIAIRLD